MRFIYTLSIFFYRVSIFLSVPFLAKAKKWQKGRKGLFLQLKEQCKGRERIVCFHCASLGEFEQGKPLMQKIKKEEPDKTILVSFFSPSGYEIKKSDPIADIVTYLPIDTPRKVKRFLNIVQPESFYFIKYEFWYNLMIELSKRKVPFFFVSVIFRPSQLFFRPWGKWFANQLKRASYFFVQNQLSKTLLNSIGIHRVDITGDTRFDRVKEISLQPFQLDFVMEFKGNAKLIVAGSTWEPDELLLREVISASGSNYKLVVAPHVVDVNHIEKLRKSFKNFKHIVFSEIGQRDLQEYDVLIVDTIGMLSKIYKYGEIAYVGGAFETGLHNILEAAVYGIPVFFGPKYEKFTEAMDMVGIGGGFSVTFSDEMIEKIALFEKDRTEYKRVCDLCTQYVNQNLGASDKIYNQVRLLHQT